MKREMSRRELFADLAKGPAGGGRMTVREDLKGNRVSLLGYGACEHVCPARPLPALTVKAHERHREIWPAGPRS